MDTETLSLLDFPRLLDLIQGFAHCPLGVEQIRKIAPGKPVEQITVQLAQIEEALRYRAAGGRFDLRHLENPGALVQAVGDGEALEPKQLLQMLEVLKLTRSMKLAFKESEWPVLATILAPIPALDPLISEIERVIEPSGEIKDNADPELSQARQRQVRYKSQIQDHLHTFFSGPRAKFLIQEPYVTSRNGRYVIPVKLEHQRDVPGLVHGTSSSGATLFVEPFTAVDLNNQVLYHEEREREIISRILRRLSDRLRGQIEVLRQVASITGRIDMLFACAEFGARNQCTIPELVEDPDLALENARHPLLIASLGLDRVVPISVRLNHEHCVLVVSGPNTGGKTVALKTVGLLAAMAGAGLPVPATHARLPVFRSLLADIGDHQSLAEQLSTFSAHILRVKRIMDRTAIPALILLDEVGAGTDPVHGAALGISLIDHFRRRGALVVATTHLQEIKQFAFSTPGVQNASVELDPKTLRPSYELRIGVAGGSSGLEMAAQLGLAREIVDHARNLLSEQDLQAERYLTSLRAEIRASHEQRQILRDEMERLKQEHLRQRAEMERREQEREKEFGRAIEAWSAEFNAEAERWLKTVKDRFEAARLRNQRKQKESILKEEFRRKMTAGAGGASDGKQQQERPESAFQVGDLVFHTFFKKRGRLIALTRDDATVEIEGKRVSARPDQLEKAEGAEESKTPARVLPQNVTLEIVEEAEQELNLVGCTVEEALSRTDKFLDRAFVGSLGQVRIIHGFGKGRLKQALAAFLGEHPHVLKHQVEGGATVVSIRP